LHRLRNKVRRLALAASTDNPLSLHALRISIKRLRYALEFFAPLLNARATKRILKRLTKLQEVLGQLNDLASAGALLMDCAGDDARLREAVTLIGGWHGKRYHRLLRGIPQELKQLKQLQLPALNASL
jgi:adenylate cyclase